MLACVAALRRGAVPRLAGRAVRRDLRRQRAGRDAVRPGRPAAHARQRPRRQRLRHRSTASMQAWQLQSMYGASKGAVALLTRCMATELGGPGSTSTPWAPGTIVTPGSGECPRTRACRRNGSAAWRSIASGSRRARCGRALPRTRRALDDRWDGLRRRRLPRCRSRRAALIQLGLEGAGVRRGGRQPWDRRRDHALVPRRRSPRRRRGALAAGLDRSSPRSKPAIASFPSGADVGDPDGAVRLIDEARTALGAVDVLCANATANAAGATEDDYPELVRRRPDAGRPAHGCAAGRAARSSARGRRDGVDQRQGGRLGVPRLRGTEGGVPRMGQVRGGRLRPGRERA